MRWGKVGWGGGQRWNWEIIIFLVKLIMSKLWNIIPLVCAVGVGTYMYMYCTWYIHVAIGVAQVHQYYCYKQLLFNCVCACAWWWVCLIEFNYNSIVSIVRVHVHIIMSIVQMCECVSCVLLYSDAVLGAGVGVAHICHLVVVWVFFHLSLSLDHGYNCRRELGAETHIELQMEGKGLFLLSQRYVEDLLQICSSLSVTHT